jgi:anaphase-promoting complex subunit 8
MWAALANCFEKMDKNEEAIKCTHWVDRVKDKEAFAMHKLAKLHLQQGDETKASQYFIENL